MSEDEKFNWYRATPEERVEYERGDWLKVKTVWWYEESTGKMQIQLIADLPKDVVFEVEKDGKTREYRDGYIVFETGTLRGNPDLHLNYIRQMAVEGRIKLPQDRDSKQPYGSPGDGPEIDVRPEDPKRTIQSKTRLFPDDPAHEAWIASKGGPMSTAEQKALEAKRDTNIRETEEKLEALRAQARGREGLGAVAQAIRPEDKTPGKK